MKKSLVALVVTATAVMSNVALATPADAYSCSWQAIGAQATPHPLNLEYDFIDVAVAEATCTDLALGTHSAYFEFEWYYDTGTGYAPMPACPTTVVAPTVPWVGAGVIAGVATCHRPPESDAFEVGRRVCANLFVDGIDRGENCSQVLLNPTPI